LKRFLFCAVCVFAGTLVNFSGSVFAQHIALPLYLDSLLTFAVVALGGLWAGIACAVLTNVALWIFCKMALPFALCHVLTALSAHCTFRRCKRGTPGGLSVDAFLWAGLWSAITNAAAGNGIVSLFVSPAVIPNISTSVQGIFAAVPNLTFAVYFSGFLTNLTDKIISAAVSFSLYKGITRLR
jgi:hypothetical protein